MKNRFGSAVGCGRNDGAQSRTIVFAVLWTLLVGCHFGATSNPGMSPLEGASSKSPNASVPGLAIPAPLPPPTPDAPISDHEDSFRQLAASVDGAIGIAYAPVGAPNSVRSFGEWRIGPAWSTSKVPVVMAAFNEQGALSSAMKSAISKSDNVAAEEVWASLGEPGVAAAKVESILRAAGDPTRVQSEQVRTQYTAFGQTMWALSDQAAFASSVACDQSVGPVIELMGQIETDQSWGLGQVLGAKFKGGWGPSESGAYLVRQFGIVPTPSGEVAVAIAAEPTSGSFEDGLSAVDSITKWLSQHIAEVPTGTCS